MNIPIFGSGNPFAKFFRFGRLTDSNVKEEHQREHNSQGVSQEQIDLSYLNYYNNMGTEPGGAGLSSVSIQFDQYFIVKAQRIAKYREMSYYPDVNDGLDMICDEAMVEDRTGEYLTLDIKEEVPEHIEEQIRDNWNYLIHQVFNLKDTGWELFRRWLVDGELYLELILNDDGDAIIDFKILPPYTMSPIFDYSSDICGYVQTPNYMFGVMGSGAMDAQSSQGNAETGYNDSTYGDSGDDGIPEVRFDKDQVVYSNYGYTGRNKLDVRGFLDPSIRIYNQLKYLEDAVVVYRIVRAPERRIWNVGVGKMPKGRAEQYIRGLIQRYRKNVYYDPSTGAMDSSRNFQAMTEDFWFAKDENGYGTEVTTLAGGQNLGEMDDVYYFERKLHQTMKIPKNRWGASGGDDASDIYTTGKSGEITREEIAFSRVVGRMQNRFGVIFMDAFLTLLRLQDFDEQYIDASIYKVMFTQSNLWKQYKEIEILEARFGILGAIETYIYKPGENDNAPFSMEFVLKNWFLMNDEEYEKNAEYLEKEKEAARLSGQDVGFDAAQQGGEAGGFGAEGGMGGEAGGEFGGEAGGGFGAEGGGMAGGGAEAGAEGGGEFGAEPAGETGEFDAEA
jgi:hypothetical protein